MNEAKTAFMNGGFEFFVKFNDGGHATFAICEDCYAKLTQEQMDEIMRSQIVNWGIEIQKQLSWYIAQAVHLKIIKWSNTKDGLKT